MTTTTMLQRLAKNNCSLLSASCSRRNLPVSAARAMAGPSLDQVLPSYLHTSPRYSNQAMSRDADAPGIYRNIRFASFLLCQSRFLCTSSQEPSIKSSESLNSFRKTPPNGKSLVCRATESSLEANTKKPTLVKSSFWGRSQGLESDAERLVCPGCGVYMQDDHPKAPGFFVKPVEKKEKLWVDAPEDNQEVTSIENKNEESQRDSNLSVDVKEDGSVLAEEGPKKAEKPVVCARCHSLRHYGKVKDESVENLLPDFDFDHTVGARLMKTTGSRSTVVMVVDCVDFDGSFPRRAAALVSKAMEEGATAWKDGKSGNVPRLVLVATKIDLLPTQVSPTRLENWARQRSRIGGAVKLHGVHMVSAHKDWGIQNLAEHIKELAGPRGNVWVIGAQNAGKSTLINAIGKHVGGKVTHLTEAPVPGTTLGIIRIEGILPAKAKLYDTPGLLHPYQISTRLNREEQVMVHIRKELKPRSYRMKVGQVVHVGGLMRLDVLETSVETIYLTVWASPHIPLHMGKLENADGMREKHFGLQLQPPIGEERVSELGAWERREFKVSGNNWDFNSMDVAAAGLGWFSIALKGEATLAVWCYAGVDITLRSALILDRARVLENPGFTVSKVVSKADKRKSNAENHRFAVSNEVSKERKRKSNAEIPRFTVSKVGKWKSYDLGEKKGRNSEGKECNDSRTEMTSEIK